MMKNKILTIIQHPMIGGSSVIFIGTFGANFINYVFNLLMGRMLTVTDYGLLVSLNSIFVLVGIFYTSFVNLIAKFSAKYHSTENKAGAHALVKHGERSIFIFASILLLILIALIPPIAAFLKITNYFFIFLIDLSIFFSIIIALPAGFFQGALRFYSLTALTIVQPLIRLVVAFSLVLMGYAVLGPLVGIMLSGLIPAIFLFIYLSRRYRTKQEDTNFKVIEFKKEFFHYTYTYFLSAIGLTLLSNTDILLVRHFFDQHIAGQYAALSLMGKAILYFTAPVIIVFFPVIAQKKEKKERLLGTLLLAVGIVTSISTVLALAYFIVPELVLKVFFPKPEYHVLINYLGYYALYILVFSVAYLFNSYFLSIGKTKVYWISLIAACVQIVSIILFHANLYEIIAGLFTSSAVMLLLLLIYYIKNGEYN